MRGKKEQRLPCFQKSKALGSTFTYLIQRVYIKEGFKENL